MKRLQVVVLMIAMMAGLGAFMLIKTKDPAPAPEAVVVTHVAAADMTEILVAASDLPMWQIVGRTHLRWQPWPTDNVPDGAITREQSPNAERDLAGLMTRTQFSGGEPLRMERLMESNGDAGFMSAMLPPGKRALAIGIDTRGTSSAGGFIHPNDRVDIIRIFQEDKGEDAPSSVFLSETLLTNIRVLAIGQAVQNTPGNVSVHGDTATVEVTPAQAEALTLAQRTGHLTLALRSFADTHDHVAVAEPTARSITVTAGGSGGFASSRFVVTQRAPAESAPPLDPAIDQRLAPTRHAEPRPGQPILRRAGEIAAAGWSEQTLPR
jgi:pilus assembly protein CpaB